MLLFVGLSCSVPWAAQSTERHLVQSFEAVLRHAELTQDFRVTETDLR